MEVRIIQDLEDLTVIENASNTSLDLFENFDDPFTTGLVASFQLEDTSLGNGGLSQVVLFDQEGEGAPISVENFINYVEDGDYVNSIIHRSVPGFVIQGGGFTVDGLQEEIQNGTPLDAINDVPTDPPILNEFSPDRSNVRGTLAYARGGAVDSATSQWFFNLSNNAANLDNQNEGFTVFGEVLSEADLIPIDNIADLPILSAATALSEPAFGELPLILDEFDNPTLDVDQDFVRYSSITVAEVAELEFSVVSNSNPGLVTTSIVDGELVLDYQDNQLGTAEIVIEATNLLGDSIEDTFVVNVLDLVSFRGDLPPNPLDIDGNGEVDALSDGLLIVRHLFGFEGDSLINGAVAADATRTTVSEIESFLNASETSFDIDGNGQADALSDGLLIVRHLFGFEGDSLINGAVAADATRTTSDDIIAHIEGLSFPLESLLPSNV